jgi:ribonuclease III
MSRAPHPLERKLGHHFGEPALLTQALTHRSFAAVHNERLEFLGDSILNCAVAMLIYERFPGMPEGELSRLRANLVNQAVLAEMAADLEIGPMLRLGEGEQKTGGATRPSILADAVEALLGAVYLDAGFTAAHAVVRALYENRFEDHSQTAPAKDAKTALQEWLQARRLALPQYTVTQIAGAAHKQTFQVRCVVGTEETAQSGVNGRADRGAADAVTNRKTTARAGKGAAAPTSIYASAVGEGASRRAAEQRAAEQVLATLQQTLDNR